MSWGLGDGCMGCEDPSTFFAHAGTGNACGSRAVSQWPRCRLRLASCASTRAFQKGSKKPRRRTRWGGEIVLREGGFGVGEAVESHVLTEFLGWHLQSKLIVDLRLGGLRVVAG